VCNEVGELLFSIVGFIATGDVACFELSARLFVDKEVTRKRSQIYFNDAAASLRTTGVIGLVLLRMIYFYLCNLELAGVKLLYLRELTSKTKFELEIADEETLVKAGFA
jgi:hypothetical protein